MSNSIELTDKWKKIHAEYKDSPEMQQAVLDIAATENGQAILEESRQKWLNQGFETAPFDFVFDNLS